MNLRRFEAPAQPEVKATSIMAPTADITHFSGDVLVREAVIAGGLSALGGRA